jgi:hypothetical protein
MSLILNGDTGISAVDGTASAPALVGNDTDTGVYFSAANTLDFATSGTRQASISSAGLFQFNSGYGSVATAYGCRAWVNFNGTGTVAIRASGNVTSITDNNTGDYTVNFTTAMPDANYAITGSANIGTANYNLLLTPNRTTAPTASACRIATSAASNTNLSDCEFVYVGIFR